MNELEIQEIVKAVSEGPTFIYNREAENDKQNHREMAELSMA